MCFVKLSSFRGFVEPFAQHARPSLSHASTLQVASRSSTDRRRISVVSFAMLPVGPTSPHRAPLTVLFSSQRSFDSTDHFCSPPFVCPARIDGLTRPLTCSQAFGTDGKPAFTGKRFCHWKQHFLGDKHCEIEFAAATGTSP